MNAATLVALLALTACKPSDAPKVTARPDDAAPAVAVPDGAPGEAEVAAEAVPVTAPARKLWTAKLPDEATFLAYSKVLGGERFGKFVIDLRSDAVYYFDVDIYKVHKDFIFQELYRKPQTKDAVRVFDRNYGPVKTDFMMCYLVHHLAQDVWTMAFWDGDRASAAHVQRAYKRMKETFFLGDKVKYRPDSNFQEAIAKTLPPTLPVVLNDQLYQASTYQPFNTGIAVGTLRAVPANVPATELTFAPDEIVILKSSLADITPVAGIVSETFSTPLAHVSLRARGWGIPNIGLKGAGKTFEGLVGKTVYFEARAADYVLREATADEIATAKAATKLRTVTLPNANLEIATLASLDAIRAKDVVIYGAKAANLGEIIAAKPPGVNVPPGFGVPYRFYAEHVRAAGIDKLIAAALADPAFATDAAVRKATLAGLRKAIVDAPALPALKDAVAAALTRLTGDDATKGVFVRSSNNAEDLDDFSGAGLYDTVPNAKGPEAVVLAIKQVWASVFNLGAYENRKLYGIDELKVYGGVLVQIGVSATAAGVLVTVHPTDPSDEKNYTINAKSGLGMSVVDGKAVPESLIVSWYNQGIRVLSRSAEDTMLVFDDKGGIHEVPNPDKGKPVLTNQMALNLAFAARKITKVFKHNKLDIEWVFAGTDLYIVQTRPYITK